MKHEVIRQISNPINTEETLEHHRNTHDFILPTINSRNRKLRPVRNMNRRMSAAVRHTPAISGSWKSKFKATADPIT